MEYRCISADCHIDLNWLRHDLFVSNASKAMKERMPFVIQDADGPRWVTKSGLNLGLANGKGCSGVTSGGRKIVPGEDHRTDCMASTGLFTDGSQGIFRPTTLELRLRDQDCDGVQAEVLFGLHFYGGNKITDGEVLVEFYRIYNDWLADFCSYDRERLVGLASIPNVSVEVAVAEARRVAKLGLGGFDVSEFQCPGMMPLWNPYWDPFWKAAAELNLPVHFHTIGRPGGTPTGSLEKDLPETLKQVYLAARKPQSPLFMSDTLCSIIQGGALERYPTLRVVLAESGIGWIPFILERMDCGYEERFKDKTPLKMKPSDYWRRQCRATFQNDRIGAKLLDDLGIENVMWASDYPHPDGVFPESQEYIKRQFGHLPSTTQRKLICENVGKFYGLM